MPNNSPDHVPKRSDTRGEVIQRTVLPLARGTSWLGPSCNNYIHK